MLVSNSNLYTPLFYPNDPLGVLRTQQNRPEEGLALNLQSLAIRSRIRHGDIRIDIHWLLRQREMLGKERFEALVAEKVNDEESRQNLYAMMEAYEQALKEAEESTQDSDGDKGRRRRIRDG